MSDKNKDHESKEIDFVTGSSFQKAIKKAKWKQTMKFLVISILSTTIILYGIFLVGQYNLQNRIDNNDRMLFSQVNGANTYWAGGFMVYGFLNMSAVKHLTIEKNVGERSIVWNRKEVKYPLFSGKQVIDNGRFSETIGYSERFNRKVHYNKFTGEREIDFYYPQLEYEYLPNELEIATQLDNNSLAEVALSFDKPYTLKEVQKDRKSVV